MKHDEPSSLELAASSFVNKDNQEEGDRANDSHAFCKTIQSDTEGVTAVWPRTFIYRVAIHFQVVSHGHIQETHFLLCHVLL